MRSPSPRMASAGFARISEAAGGFDLVVSDIRMPGMDGIEMAKAAARRFPGLRILLVTGYADQRERAADLNGVVVDVLLKPFTLAEIRERVARALSRRHRDLLTSGAEFAHRRAMTSASAAAGHKPPFPEASAICRLPAVELARRIRERRIPVVEVVGAFLDRIEAVNGAVNAIVSLRGRAEILAEASGRRPQACRRRRARAAVRPADRGQGSDADEGPAYDFRLAHLRRFRAAGGQLRRRAHARCRRHHHRQDQRAGIRLRLADLQRSVRHDAQRLRPAADVRRVERRRRGGAGARHAARGRRQRHGRLAAQSGRLEQCFRLPHLAGQGGGRAGQRTVHGADGRQGADGAQRRRPRAAARRPGRL